ncbi:hypothetical protein [Salinibacter altiplanensis]|uniref:hypothetical protein n=1 Tax=Salinibacter altiplanensis TaxID=1803181 RepID=UPI000C9F199A|nr:hypothetical protein [Salinibacter altiplanensis]
MNDFKDYPEPEGDGASHVTLSEAIESVLVLMAESACDLKAIRDRLRGEAPPDGPNIEEDGQLGAQARAIADQLETCVNAIRIASGKPSDSDSKTA